MSSVLKLTLATGDVHDVPFFPTSTLTVIGRVDIGGGVIQDITRSYTDVVDVELVEIDDVLAAAEAAVPGMLSSPAVAIVHAKGLPLADAGAHIERALMKFPDDADLHTVWADINDAVRVGSETWTTSVEVDADAIAAEPGVEGGEGVAADPDAWLASPETANAYVNGLESVEDAVAALDVATAKFPFSSELADTKRRAERYVLGKRIEAVGSHADANALAAELGVPGFEEKTPLLDEKKAALEAAAAAKA